MASVAVRGSSSARSGSCRTGTRATPSVRERIDRWLWPGELGLAGLLSWTAEGHGCPLLSRRSGRPRPGRGPSAPRPVQPATDQQLVDELALSPQDDRRPWSAPTATQARGGAGESSLPGPTLRGDSSTGRGCTGRAGWRSRPRRRCGRCQSSGLAARRSGRGACPPSAPSCLERPHGRASQTLSALPRPRAVATGQLSEGCDPPCWRRSGNSIDRLAQNGRQPCAGTMRPRTRR
jgi:hypothetical protein